MAVDPVALSLSEIMAVCAAVVNYYCSTGSAIQLTAIESLRSAATADRRSARQIKMCKNGYDIMSLAFYLGK